MDDVRFDHWTRQLAGRVGRRQLIAGLAALAGASISRRPAAGQATCPYPYVQCGGTPSGCCAGCTNPGLEQCGLTCCPTHHEYEYYCADFAYNVCCPRKPLPDPAVTTRICYFRGNPEAGHCVYEPPQCAPTERWNEEDCGCQRCADGKDACNNVCCDENEQCEEGQCVGDCQASTGRGRQNRANADCRCPTPGMIICQDRCVLACPSDQILNPDTCVCDCLGDSCGNRCCPLGEECATEGGSGFPSVCCERGTSCAGGCLKENEKCCSHPVHGRKICPKGTTCCFSNTSRARCCGNGQKCEKGKCVKKKRRQR